MPWDESHRDRTRQKILKSASKLFTRDGFDSVSINDVMKDAGLTRGAFYTHFESKADLYAESILESATRMGRKIRAFPPDTVSAEQLVAAYLSVDHRNGENYRCPLAFLTTDISQRDETVRDAYTRVFKGFVKTMYEQRTGQSAALNPQQAIAEAVIMIGGLAIARAVNDDELAEQLLSACQQQLSEAKTGT